MHNEVLEELIVVKRSGQRVSFNASKVAIAIKKAFDSIGQDDEKKIFKVFERVLSFINSNYKDRKTINVEDIQDIIEQSLLKENEKDVYNSFKEYRERRSLSRKLFTEKSEHKFVKAIEKIEEKSICDNSKSIFDIKEDFSRIISSEYTKSYILDTKSVKALEEGNIYLHDLDYFSLGLISSIHPIITSKMLESNFSDFVASITLMQKEISKEIVLDNLDIILESYFLSNYKNSLIKSFESILKIMGFYEYVNVKKISELILKEKNVSIDIKNYEGLLLNDTIKSIFEKVVEKEKESLEIKCNKKISDLFNCLESFSERPQKFTISFAQNDSQISMIINKVIFKLLKENKYPNINFIIKNPIKNSDNILESLNNNIYLNFTNDKEYFASGILVNKSEENSYKGKMLVCNSSINLARLGLKYQNKDISKFYEELDNLLELVKNGLIISFENIAQRTKDYYKTLFKGNVYDDEKLEDGQKIRKVLKNGSLAIGLVGLKECTLLLEKDDSKRLKFTENIIDYINKKVQSYQSETHINFVVYETSNSKALSNLLKIDKAIYGNVKMVTDKERYEMLDEKFLGNIKDLCKISKCFTGGKLINIHIPKNITNKKFVELINELSISGAEFVKLGDTL